MGRLTHTVSGDIASFRTPSRVPIESLKFHFLPKQASGTPSPENPIPIEGWTGLNGKKAKKNLIKPYYTEPATYYGIPITPTANGVRVTGTATVECAIRLSSQNVRFLEKGKKYTFSLYVNGDISGCKDPYIGYFDGVSYWGTMGSLTEANNHKLTWTVPERYSNAVAPWFDMYIRIKEGSTVDFEIGLQMEAGENATSYEPYSEEPIPITFPSNGKNRYYYDENNVETGVTLSSGLIRSIYHTGVYGNGNNISISATAIDPEVVSNSTFNIGYIIDNVVYVLDSFIWWEDGSVRNRTVIVPDGSEFVILATIDSAWVITRNLPRYNIQIEYSDEPTSYVPYSSDNTFYGGYIDPVVGEIVATHAKCAVSWGEGGTNLGTVIRQAFTLPFVYKTGEELHDYGQGPYRKRTLCNISSWKWDYYNDSVHYYIHGQYAYVFLPSDTTVGAEIEFCAELATPIHIPIPAEDMKAFLDHNNFWSDANDVTEVAYPVTESKDILATRKKAIAFDHAHHKKVKWNQLSLDGDFQISSDWWPTSGYGSIAFNNNVATWTALQTPSQYYQTGFVRKTNHLAIPYDHKVLVIAKMKTSCTNYSTSNLMFAIYGMVTSTGGAHTYYYRQNVVSNDWQDVKGFIRDRPLEPPSGFDDVIIKKFKPLLAKNNNSVPWEDVITEGDTMEVKNLMAFDLTQMFGAGNEPSTVAEFERICAINGIDLTTYQPYDEGSDRWLIIP